MRKLLLVVYLEMFVFCCFPVHKFNLDDIMKQSNKVETKENLLLNETEGAYLNEIFIATRKDFNFIDKKIGFFTGSSGATRSNKEDYFNMQKRHSVNENYPCDNGTLYIFNTEQKMESGGYDAAIVYWSKFVVPIEKVIKRLKRYTQ